MMNAMMKAGNKSTFRESNNAMKEKTINMLLMETTRKREDFSDQEIEDYHDLCLNFMDKWVKLAGAAHVTNYIHIIGSGHLIYFLQRFRNLYKYSQQGWEAMNSKIKKYYHHNTNHGGNVGGHAQLKQGHIKPLWLFLSRHVTWRTGHGAKFFQDRERNANSLLTAETETLTEDIEDTS